MQKALKTVQSTILKNDGHFRIPYPQTSLEQYSKICENVVFFYYVRGGKVLEDFHKAIQFLKIKKWSV